MSAGPLSFLDEAGVEEHPWGAPASALPTSSGSGAAVTSVEGFGAPSTTSSMFGSGTGASLAPTGASTDGFRGAEDDDLAGGFGVAQPSPAAGGGYGSGGSSSGGLFGGADGGSSNNGGFGSSLVGPGAGSGFGNGFSSESAAAAAAPTGSSFYGNAGVDDDEGNDIFRSAPSSRFTTAGGASGAAGSGFRPPMPSETFQRHHQPQSQPQQGTAVAQAWDDSTIRPGSNAFASPPAAAPAASIGGGRAQYEVGSVPPPPPSKQQPPIPQQQQQHPHPQQHQQQQPPRGPAPPHAGGPLGGGAHQQQPPAAASHRAFASHTTSFGVGAAAQQGILPGGYAYNANLASSYSPFARVDSLHTRKETPEDMYGVPENFLEVEVKNAMTHGFGRKQYTDYEIVTRVSISCSSACSLPNLFALPCTYRPTFPPSRSASPRSGAATATLSTSGTSWSASRTGSTFLRCRAKCLRIASATR